VRCQKCPKPAMVHITEVLSEESFEELHLCEDCAQRFLDQVSGGRKSPEKSDSSAELEPLPEPGSREKTPTCPHCGISFAEYRSTGRLGCLQDYDVFREDLVALLENVHGETRHCGKEPKNLERHRQVGSAKAKLSNDLRMAISREDYEEAAKLRDQIKSMEF
jgi:protein arginine kinase activator